MLEQVGFAEARRALQGMVAGHFGRGMPSAARRQRPEAAAGRHRSRRPAQGEEVGGHEGQLDTAIEASLTAHQDVAEASLRRQLEQMPATLRGIKELVTQIRSRPAPAGDDAETPALHVGDIDAFSPRAALRLPALLIAQHLPDIWAAPKRTGVLEVLTPVRVGGQPAEGVLRRQVVKTMGGGKASPADVEALARQVCGALDADAVTPDALRPIVHLIQEVVHAIPRPQLAAILQEAVGAEDSR